MLAPMRRGMRRNLAIATAVAAIVAAVLIATLSGGGPHHNNARSPARTSAAGELTLSARYLGIGVEELRKRLRSGSSLAAVARSTSGHSESGLIEAIMAPQVGRIESEHLSRAAEASRIAHLRARLEAQLTHRRRPRDLAAAARYLGITSASVVRQLGQGRSLAQIAASVPGHTAAGLEKALVQARRERYEHYVAAGVISRSEARKALEGVRGRVHAEVYG
jgi:hypothetical protein